MTGPNTFATSSRQPEANGVESLNRDCFCISLDNDALKREFEADAQTSSVYPLILEKCPHLFAAVPVFVSRPHLDRHPFAPTAIRNAPSMQL